MSFVSLLNIAKMGIDIVLAFNGFVFSSFVLFFVLKNIGFKKNHVLFLIGFLLNINLYMLFTLFGTLLSARFHFFLSISPIPFYLLSGPFVYLYAYSIIHNNQLPKGTYKHFLVSSLHFIPLLSLLLTDTLRTSAQTYYGQLTSLLALPFFIAYIIVAIFKINIFKKKWNGKKPYFLSVQASWLMTLLIVLVSISTLLYLASLLLQFNVIELNTFKLYSLGLRNLLIFWLAYQGIFLPLIKKELRVLLFFEKEYEKLSNIDVDSLSKKLEGLIVEKKAFLNPDINIEQVALEVGVLSRDISYYYNTILEVKFRDYINRLRVNAMLAYLEEHDQEPPKVAWLANQFGYKSSLTAQRAFKKNTGKTIGAFLSSTSKA